MALITQKVLDKLKIIKREQSPSVSRGELGEDELIDELIERKLVIEKDGQLKLSPWGEWANGETELFLIHQHLVEFGHIDGEHHKQWILDRILRIVCQRFEFDYDAVVEIDFGGSWDQGIAP